MAKRTKPRREPPAGGRILDAYRKVRKPMPPAERVIPDKRREQRERLAEREAREEAP